jgi:purine-cytosine permease-like protein
VALLVVLVPWTAINLIDFYIVHKGVYDLESIFRFDGGIYGRFNRAAITAYALGIVVQIPFMATSLYTGPVAEHLGGADLSWLAGLIVTGPIYLLLARRAADPTTVAAIQPNVEEARVPLDLAAQPEG